MIPGDLNQLPKKIKRASPSPAAPAVCALRLSSLLLACPPASLSLSLSLSLPLPSPFLSSPLPPHDNESLPCGRGIICGTGSKMPCEPHYRMHDYHDSGTAPVPTSLPSPPPPSPCGSSLRGRCRAPRNCRNRKSTARPGQRSRNWSGPLLPGFASCEARLPR